MLSAFLHHKREFIKPRLLAIAWCRCTTALPQEVPSLLASLFSRKFARLEEGLKSESEVKTTYEMQRRFTQAQVLNFLELTGDPNPIHVDEEAAKNSGFKGPILPGILLGSIFPAIIAQHHPGAIYLSQTLKFRTPVLVGSNVKAQLRVEKVAHNQTRFSTFCFSDTGHIAVEGIAFAILQPKNTNDHARTQSQ